MVQRFHAILIWPLELLLPVRLRGLTKEEGFVRKLSDEVVRSSAGLWQSVDVLDRGTAEDPDLPYAEFVYFHPFAQRVLYPPADDKNPALAILGRKDIEGVKVELLDADTVTFDVKRIHLYLFRSQTALIVVEVSNRDPLEMHTALQFADQFRRAYAPFYWQGRAGHCPVKVRWLVAEGHTGSPPPDSDFDNPAAMYKPVANPSERKAPIAAHWRWLIQPLKGADEAGSDQIAVEQLEDDRIPSMLYLGMEDPFAVSPGDFMRICFCDEKGNSNDFPYGRRFLADFEQKHCYDRFWNPPHGQDARDEWRSTRYLCCGYNLAIVTKPFGLGDHILSQFRHHYFQLGLLAHFHRASLLKYSRRLTVAVAEAENPGEGKPWESLARVRREFADFINQYWFREISNQEQGKELFHWWSEKLGNRELLDQLTKEAGAVDGILNQDFQRKLQLSTDRLTKALFWLAGLTLIVALLDWGWVRNVAEWVWDQFLGYHLDCRFHVWWLAALTLGLGGIGFLILFRVYRKWYPRKERDDAHQG